MGKAPIPSHGLDLLEWPPLPGTTDSNQRVPDEVTESDRNTSPLPNFDFSRLCKEWKQAIDIRGPTVIWLADCNRQCDGCDILVQVINQATTSTSEIPTISVSLKSHLGASFLKVYGLNPMIAMSAATG